MSPFPRSCTSTSTTSTAHTAARARGRGGQLGTAARHPVRRSSRDGARSVRERVPDRSSRRADRVVEPSTPAMLLTEPSRPRGTVREGSPHGREPIRRPERERRTRLDKPSPPRPIDQASTRKGLGAPKWVMRRGAFGVCDERLVRLAVDGNKVVAELGVPIRWQIATHIAARSNAVALATSLLDP